MFGGVEGDVMGRWGSILEGAGCLVVSGRDVGRSWYYLYLGVL